MKPRWMKLKPPAQAKRIEYVAVTPDLLRAVKVAAAIEGMLLTEYASSLIKLGAEQAGIYPLKEKK